VTWLLAGLLVLAGTAGNLARRNGVDAALAPGREGGRS
jgi:hypothetical protein